MFPYTEYTVRHSLSFIFQGTQPLGISAEVVYQRKAIISSVGRDHTFLA